MADKKYRLTFDLSDGTQKSVEFTSPQGERGKSAYEIALDSGFNGTKQAWLESLEGKSAYEVDVELGFEGDEEEWIESMRGDKGDKGDKGDTVTISDIRITEV